MIGVNEKLIRRAIESGKIAQGVDYTGKKPKIIVSIALRECRDNSIGMTRKTSSIEDLPSNNQPIDFDTKKSSRKERTNTDPKLVDYQIEEKRLKNEKLQIELQAMAGRFIDKEIIDKELAEKGLMIRDSFMALPDRETDNLIALANDRDNFYIYFQKLMRDNLTILSSEILKQESKTTA
ncbi:MAG: hypothetical protein Q8861_02040 [Bacteroidota bacterium]|nr:hypothetical protein [Bacteroidota bacterium]